MPSLDYLNHFSSVEHSLVQTEATVPPNLLPRGRDYSAALIWPAPEFESSSHWHPSDTLYIPLSGELHVKGEGVYKPGDCRWVMGGTAYDAEQASDDPLESLLISFGPMGRFDADETPAPNGDTRRQNR